MSEVGLEILVIEDKDDKFAEVCAAVLSCVSGLPRVSRATTITEGEDALESKPWDLLVLDVSMDISGSSIGPMKGGHANLGGLDILERMYLLSIDIPTIVVTGFDYFQSIGSREEAEFIDLAELDRRIRHYLGPNYRGCVRYGVQGWQDRLAEKLGGGL